MIFDKCYITYNITCTIISHIFQNLSLRILFLASLKINDWLIKKKKILLVETVEKMYTCLSIHQETGGNIQ